MRSVCLISFLMTVGTALAAYSSGNLTSNAENAQIIEIIANILAPWISRPPSQPTDYPTIDEWLSSLQNQTSNDNNTKEDTAPQAARFYSPIVTASSSANDTSGSGINY